MSAMGVTSDEKVYAAWNSFRGIAFTYYDIAQLDPATFDPIIYTKTRNPTDGYAMQRIVLQLVEATD